MKLSGFTSGIQKFFSKERVMILAVFVLLGMFLLWYSTGKTTVRDGMTPKEKDEVAKNIVENMESGAPPAAELPHPSDVFKKNTSTDAASGYVAQPIANPSDLLPKDANSEWSSLNPIDNNRPELPDLLQAGYHIGLDTIGQSMKNANLQLRSDPVIAKTDVGPWNNSTYEPDLLRQPLEVGCASG
jgi:hypothetical protein